MTVTVEERPVVEFDHYFTDIDESLVETSDLLVKNSDRSVFTKNTNIVSNFDDVYIIECASVEEARFVYSYYVDKVDSISDLSKVISIATDENEEVLLYAFSTKKGAQISPSSNIVEFSQITQQLRIQNIHFLCEEPELQLFRPMQVYRQLLQYEVPEL